MNSYSVPSILLACGSLLCFLVLAFLRGRRAVSRPVYLSLLALLGLLALTVHLGVFQRDTSSGELYVREPPMHVRELYHYYLGTKYFDELGYTGLYEATVIADQRDDMQHFRGSDVLRNLSNYDGVSRVDVVQRGPEIMARFSPERWNLFREDVEMFRVAVGRETWQELNWLTDHGYNGSPVVTALLGTLANIDPIDSEGFLRMARWFDLALVGAMLLVVMRLLGMEVGLTLAFFWFVNPFNDYNYIGGSFLRYPFACSLALAFACHGRGRGLASGAFLALSTMLRIFPVVFVVALAVKHLLGRGRREALRAQRGFCLSFVATCALLLASTWSIQASPGQPAWAAFAGNMQLHASSYGSNQVGLSVPLLFSSDALGNEDPLYDEHAARAARAHGRRVVIWIAGLAALAGIAVASRAMRERQCLFLGFALLFVLQPTAHYYFLILGLTPLIFRRDRAVDALLAFGFMLLMVAFSPTLLGDLERFCAIASVLLGVLLAALISLRSVLPAPLTSEPSTR